MIRYDISIAELNARIDRYKASWRGRAATALDGFRRSGAYQEPPSPFWSEIKPVYMRLQRYKCAFCERKLTVRTKDHDVEHFRPKRAVVAWPPPNVPSYPFPTGGASPHGYYLLAYHPLNYAASCEHCNRGLKRSYFPVEAARMVGQHDPVRLRPEKPLLIYPIGDIDADPEDLLRFSGIIPTPKEADTDQHANHRARVTIDFFDLAGREELRRERAEVIESLDRFLECESDTDPDRRRRARKIVRRMTSDGSRHTNCARSFVAVFRRDPLRAERLAELATRYLNRVM